MNVNGLTIAELASELGISAGAVKMRLIRKGIKPILARPIGVYPRSALAAIRSKAGPGRPKKSREG